jgi:hypothetical protein
LAYVAAISVSFIPGVAALYPATAFEAAFGSWFGIWGAIASYAGLVVAGSASGWFSLPLGLLLSTSDFLMALAPAALVRLKLLDPAIPRIRDAITFVLGTLLFGSVPGSLIYNYVNLSAGAFKGWNTYWVAVAGWNIGNLVVLIVIGLPLMKFGTLVIKRMDLYVSRWM